jgi:hypothetical protein
MIMPIGVGLKPLHGFRSCGQLDTVAGKVPAAGVYTNQFIRK